MLVGAVLLPLNKARSHEGGMSCDSTLVTLPSEVTRDASR